MASCEEIREFFSNDTYAIHTGIYIDEAANGEAVCSFEIKDYHMNSGGAVQGGAIFTLADFTFAVAANSLGKMTVSVNNNISYLRPAKGKKLIGKSKCLGRTKRMCFYEVYITDDIGTEVAKMSVTGYIKNIDNFTNSNEECNCKDVNIRR